MSCDIKTQKGIYIHIPFCISKCIYCDFCSAPADDDTKERYVNALCAEIAHAGKEAEKNGDDRSISTVFFGGGTPSILPAQLFVKIMCAVREAFSVSEDAEITVECNPGTLTAGKLRAYRSMGVNRLSIGLQSPDNRELRALGRIHTYEQFEESYYAARDAGFDNINIDIMSAIPYQTVTGYQSNLEKIVKLNPEHISAYSLIVEEGTPLFDKVERSGGDILPTEDEDRQMYALTKKILADAGYRRYEISNYARPGFECRHNASYWERTDYIGFGVAAASLLKKSESYPQSRRFTNTSDLEGYIKNPIDNHSEEELLTQDDEMEEFMFLGLRMMAGISTESFKEVFGLDFYEVYGEIAANQMKQGKFNLENFHHFSTNILKSNILFETHKHGTAMPTNACIPYINT